MREALTLDQSGEIRRIDGSNMLGHCVRFPDYLKDASELAGQVRIPSEVRVCNETVIRYGRPRNIIIEGMGGSAIGGEMLRGWLRAKLPVPVQICRNYTLPAYANRDTLTFIISYSGDTEETLSAFVDAIRRRCMVISITSGGHLLAFAKKLNIPHVMIPKGLPPRAAFPYLFFSLLRLLTRMKIISGTEQETQEALAILRCMARENAPETPVKNNPSKRLALELKGTIPVIYGFGPYEAVAHRLKTQFNENSKIPSMYNVFPELNHNEIIGWEASENLTRNFSIILLRDHDELREVKSRIELTKSLLLDKNRKIHELYGRGKHRLAKMLSLLFLGDFLSVYLAALSGFDPTPVKSIETIKLGMRKRFDHAEKLRREIDNILS
ncbi:MAG: bifunctional phosphoglucose/phosphomannose isomerase [Candidatus Bathyarchaeota archaeon]|nr:MAG: bifunctional phosphoglucose/phosphomannose isomerase [Candidatus Bathyarchaeota archaeon]